MSGFDGSAGTVLVMRDAAFLWTDGRYFLQAEQQLDASWTLMRAGLPSTPTISDFLKQEIVEGQRVGIDPYVHSVDNAKGIRDAVEEKGGELVSVERNPVDGIWSSRPHMPDGKVRCHKIEFSGKSIREKLTWLREEMESKAVQHVLFSMLDEVCWLFNVRGEDIPHCPVVVSYALISATEARFYVDSRKLRDDVEQMLKAEGVSVVDYDNVVQDVRALEGKVWLDPSSTSMALSEAAGEGALRASTPVMMAKACKNEAELKGMREAHLRDGVALSSFLCWLEDFVGDGKELSEVEAGQKLEEFRSEQDGFLTTSFGTIAGAGANGAIIHYSPEEGACGRVSGKEVFLLDSGGQYIDGTTDVTRTMQLGGAATDYEKECYTRVLQGHIAIDTAVFPEETTGLILDALARVPLWRIGLDYRHGTGHGVGAGLNVHEGPQSISPRLGSNKAGLKAGMIVSNEPGYYEDGCFGIRIENLLIVVKKSTPHEFGGRTFLGFERLTHVPMDTGMIKPALLSTAEIQWLDNYHEQVWQKLSPRMEDGRSKEWLREKTRPLSSVVGQMSRTGTKVGAN